MDGGGGKGGPLVVESASVVGVKSKSDGSKFDTPFVTPHNHRR